MFSKIRIPKIISLISITKGLIRVTLDSLSNEPISRTRSRISAYFSEPHRFKLLDTSGQNHYERFLKHHFDRIKHELTSTPDLNLDENGPLISVIIPTYNPNLAWLNAAVVSVIDQWYQNFEIIIYDDGSKHKTAKNGLKKTAKLDNRIRLIVGNENQHICGATNSAIQESKGTFIALLDHDDLLAPYALAKVVQAINRNPDADIFYTDEDKVDASGNRFGPYFKSDFDDVLLLRNNYINHLLVVRKALGERLGWMRKGFEGAQDHDFLLRALAAKAKFIHIPVIGYSWRQHAGSTAMDHGQKQYAWEAGRKAIQSYLDQTEPEARVDEGLWRGAYQITRLINKPPFVSIIIPFKDEPGLLQSCVHSILEKTKYPEYELILVNNRSVQPETEALLQKFKENPKVQLRTHDKDFNFAQINNETVNEAKGSLVLFLNNDTEVINNEWLNDMVMNLLHDDIGIVGANLRYQDETVQHQGVVLGIGGYAGHLFRHFPADQPLHFSQGIVRQYSAVTGACLLTKKDLFTSVNGFDEHNFPIAFNDVDYCLKVRSLGFKVIYTPNAKLYHYESKTRGYEDTPEKLERFKREGAALRNKWGALIDNDPFYNPNLTLDREDISWR